MGRGYKNSINSSSLRITSSVNKIKLKQLGAKVESVQSKIYHVTFMVEETKLEYYYNINESGKFFLERMTPFYKDFGVFTEENYAIKAIYEDVEYFKNAVNSKNYQRFVELSREIEKIHDDYSYLFLHHNIPADSLDRLEEHVKAVKERVAKYTKTAEEIKIDCDIENVDVDN